MIGHYLLTLTPAQETLVLTESFGPILGRHGSGDNRCLLMVVQRRNAHEAPKHKFWGDARPLALHYDDLCERFGVERINRVIRERILANQARRMLAHRPEAVCTS